MPAPPKFFKRGELVVLRCIFCKNLLRGVVKNAPERSFGIIRMFRLSHKALYFLGGKLAGI